MSAAPHPQRKEFNLCSHTQRPGESPAFLLAATGSDRLAAPGFISIRRGRRHGGRCDTRNGEPPKRPPGVAGGPSVLSPRPNGLLPNPKRRQSRRNQGRATPSPRPRKAAEAGRWSPPLSRRHHRHAGRSDIHIATRGKQARQAGQHNRMQQFTFHAINIRLRRENVNWKRATDKVGRGENGGGGIICRSCS